MLENFNLDSAFHEQTYDETNEHARALRAPFRQTGQLRYTVTTLYFVTIFGLFVKCRHRPWLGVRTDGQ